MKKISNKIIGLITFCLIATMVTLAFAEESVRLGPGDKGYKHSEYHAHYQKLFKQGRCFCKAGECRPTKYDIDLSVPSGYKILVSGKWHPVPENTILRRRIPPALWRERAHVCAYPLYKKGKLTGEYKIECVILNIVGT